MNAEMIEKIENLEFKDPGYATFICTLQDPEGNPVPNETITMHPVNGTNVTYTTNENGQILYKTLSEQVIFNDSGFPGYFDQIPAINNMIDSVVGVVYRPILKRSKNFTNGQTISLSGSGNVKFSNLTDGFNINIASGAGGCNVQNYSSVGSWLNIKGGYSNNQTRVYFTINPDISTIDRGVQNNDYGDGEGGKGDIIEFHPNANTIYNYAVGSGGSSGIADSRSSSTGGVISIKSNTNYSYLEHISFDNRKIGGHSGGTSYFGDYWYSGGRGGMSNIYYNRIGKTYGSQYNSAGGSVSAKVIIANWDTHNTIFTYTTSHWYNHNGTYAVHVIPYISVNASISGGQSGYCRLENFQYK